MRQNTVHLHDTMFKAFKVGWKILRASSSLYRTIYYIRHRPEVYIEGYCVFKISMRVLCGVVLINRASTLIPPTLIYM